MNISVPHWLFTAMCCPILPLFGIEKRKDTLCLADFCLFWAKRVNPLLIATLFSNFSESKKLQKIFAAQTPQRKRGFFSTHLTIVGKTFQHLRHSLSSLADAPHCSMMGSVRSKTISESLLLLIYQTVNRTRFSDQLAVARWLWLNVSFMFSWRKSASLIKLNTKIYSVHCSTTLHRVFYIHKSNIWTKFLADRQAGQKGESCWLRNNA